MTLSPMVAEWVAIYEQKYGRKPTETAIRMTEHIVKVGGMLKKQAGRDIREGRKALQDEAFHSLVRWVFSMDKKQDPEFVQAIAELWQSDYMEGYQIE